MFKRNIIFTSILSLSSIIAFADSKQSIDILNDCSQPLNIAAANNDQTFQFRKSIPAYAVARICFEITKIETLQNKLFEAIESNDYEEVRRAIQAGANIKKEINGKTPLFWAVSLNKTNAIKCLFNHGVC